MSSTAIALREAHHLTSTPAAQQQLECRSNSQFTQGLEKSVQTDMSLVKASPLVPDDILVHGCVRNIVLQDL